MARELHVERVVTQTGKRRAVVRVLKDALRDSQRETGLDKVVGIFGVVIKEDGTASLLSAVTVDELRIVMKAIPAALQATSQAIVRGDKSKPGN